MTLLKCSELSKCGNRLAARALWGTLCTVILLQDEIGKRREIMIVIPSEYGSHEIIMFKTVIKSVL